MIREYGSASEGLLKSLDDEADVSLRFDPLKISAEELLAQIDSLPGVSCKVSLWTEKAVLLTDRASLKDLPAIRNGSATVQDVGSQMVSIVADPLPGMNVFDACSGAGGKSIHMADLMRGEGSVVAHDIARSRLSRLEERLRLAPRSSIEIMYPDRYVRERSRLVDSFDLVLLDVPCSGSGTFRRNPGLKLTLVPTDVERACGTQGSVLEEYSQLVRSGGVLVYATCSLLREENEEMVERFLVGNQRFQFEPILPGRGVPAEMILDGFLRTRPDKHGTDGFFAARLRRVS
jgi:16S rRNA (cytosine967-C5)-methyltransferase